jgi:hypothetical protein
MKNSWILMILAALLVGLVGCAPADNSSDIEEPSMDGTTNGDSEEAADHLEGNIDSEHDADAGEGEHADVDGDAGGEHVHRDGDEPHTHD